MTGKETVDVEVRILGAHQSESRDFHFTGFLVDERLAIDAGSLATGLSLTDQRKVQHVLITHRHWDHVKDLAGFGFNRLHSGPIDVYCTDEVRRIVSANLLNPDYWLNFFDGPDPKEAVFRHQAVAPNSQFAVDHYQVTTVPVNHSVPTLGYQIVDSAGRALYYTGDNGPGCGQHWIAARPDVLITEVTYSNAFAEESRRFFHLCPSQLKDALEVFRGARGYLPRVIAMHINSDYEAAIRREIADLADELGASIEVAHEGMVVSL